MVVEVDHQDRTRREGAVGDRFKKKSKAENRARGERTVTTGLRRARKLILRAAGIKKWHLGMKLRGVDGQCGVGTSRIGGRRPRARSDKLETSRGEK